MAIIEPPPRERVLSVVRQLARELNPGRDFERLGDSAHLEYDLGIGSLERLELMRRLESALERRLPSEVMVQARNCGDLIAILGRGTVVADEVPLVRVTPGQAPPPPLTAATLLDALAYQAEHQPNRDAIFLLREGRQQAVRTFAQLVEEARKVAGGLAAYGVGAGDRVAIMLPTGTEFVATFFAVLMRRAIPVPMYPPFRPDQVEEHVRRQAAILENAGTRVLVAFAEMGMAAKLLRLQAPSLRHVVTAPDLLAHDPVEPTASGGGDIALIQYTSGSTGVPKGVMLSHDNLLANIRAYGHGAEIRTDDVIVTWLPLYHDMGLIGTLLGGTYWGWPVVLMGPQDFLARPARWLRAVHEYRGTVSAAPNFAYELCASKIPDSDLEGLDLSSWRLAVNGAEAVRPATLRRFVQRLAPYGLRPTTILPVYGLAEATLAVTFCPLHRDPVLDVVDRERLERDGHAWPAEESASTATFVSCGRPLEHTEIRVVDPRGHRLDERCVGSLHFRSPGALQAYYRNEAATASICLPDGWVDTGDQAYIADGELYITGRHKDIILRAGRNLHAEDIEDAASAVKGVRRGCAAAFAVPDDASGTEQMVVVVETRVTDAAERARLEEAVRREVAVAVGAPADRVMLAPPHSVPKTPSGKIRRSACRDLYLSGTLGQRRGVVAQALSLAASGARRWGAQLVSLPLRGLYTLWWNLCLFLFGVVLLGVATVNRNAGRRAAPALCRLLLAAAGVRVEVSGPEPPPGACVVLANHASKFDPLVMLAAWPRPLQFVVAPWVSRGMLRFLMEPLGHLSVQRGNAQQTPADVERMREVLRDGGCLAAFPEGGLEHSPGLRPFALGMSEVAAKEGRPVVPLALHGTRELMPGRRFVPRPGRVRVTVCSPLLAADDSWNEVVTLARNTRAAIAPHCGEPLTDRRLWRED